MTYLDLCLLLEMFTLRIFKDYEKGLVVRCREFILGSFKEVMELNSNEIMYFPYSNVINYMSSDRKSTRLNSSHT